MRNKETVRTLAYLIRTYPMYVLLCACVDCRLFVRRCSFVYDRMLRNALHVFNILLQFFCCTLTLCIKYIYFRFHSKYNELCHSFLTFFLCVFLSLTIRKNRLTAVVCDWQFARIMDHMAITVVRS